MKPVASATSFADAQSPKALQVEGAVMKYFVKEPTVDVVIVNWNYAHFVADAIQSVKDQSYQNFRCIIVDNGSDDESGDRIAEAIGNHPQFTFHRLPTNLGHLGGALWSLRHLTGEFITFLDADDVLFPHYLASHLQAHLAIRSSAGFTSSNCVEMNADGEILTGGNCNMYHFWRRGTPGLRPMERAVRLMGMDDSAYSALAQAVRYLPAHTVNWIWCPGSSNMFRRALFDRIRPTIDPSPTLFGGVDGFFLPILHALTGTILIDQPLSAYRLHGSNDYSALPKLQGISSAHPNGNAQWFNTYLRTLTWLVDHVDDIVRMTGTEKYWQVLDTVSATHPNPRDAFAHPKFQAALARLYSRLVALFGEQRLFQELRRRLLFSEYLRIVVAASGRKFPIAEFSRAFSQEIARKGRLLSFKSRKQRLFIKPSDNVMGEMKK
jgi:glycosyltransferase involved in cell wall biosynthesis